MIPGMKCHISQTFMAQKSRGMGMSAETTKDDGQLLGDYSLTFRELFCIAASDLADQLEVSLENIGVLCHDVLSTGTRARSGQRFWKTRSVDIEQNSVDTRPPGRGQLLFLTRCVDRKDSERLQNAGFRFTEIQSVGEILAKSMHITSDNLVRRLLTIRDYASESKILESGVHLGCFIIRASVGGGFDVLVRKDAKNQLPTKQVPLKRLDSLHLEYLQQCEGMTVAECLKAFEEKKVAPSLSPNEQTFITQLHTTLEGLRDEIDDGVCNEAVFTSKPVMVPCRGASDESRPSEAQVIVFHSLAPIHFRAPSPKLEFVPLSFFKTLQHVYKNSPDHGTFARKVHREFGTILDQSLLSNQRIQRTTSSSKLLRLGASQNQLSLLKQPEPSRSKSTRSLRLWHRSQAPSVHSFSHPRSTGGLRTSDTSSEKNLVEVQTFGGIMVSQEVSVDVRELGSEGASCIGDGRGGDTEMTDLKVVRLGTLGMAGKEVEDPETFVDRLFSTCVERR